ncbi:ligase-associated DNA damage response endonuclease PdeM [Yoonia sp.]|uniref:ligase-associated DNA damage response endonuclease PdeM n=1 Tax=Yoonia sp. TaxID=2212373 RepID=UPI0023B5649F
MNGYDFTFYGVPCRALPSGGLYLPDQDLFCISDLHLGKSERIARGGGAMLPPYEVRDTLQKLQDDIATTSARTVICLGDSFDDTVAAHHLAEDMRLWLMGLQAGRKWIWIEGNHDPGPVDLGGAHLQSFQTAGLVFRHIATDATAEISGHYHPKHSLAGRSRPAFLVGDDRIIMPAYGAYTGGLRSNAPPVRALFDGPVTAVMTGRKALAVPV